MKYFVLVTAIALVSITVIIVYFNNLIKTNNVSQPSPTAWMINMPAATETSPYKEGFAKTDWPYYKTPNVIEYNGYEIEKILIPAKKLYDWDNSVARIKKNGKILVELKNGYRDNNATEFDLSSFLGGEEKQILITQHSGGNHCCYIVKLYNLIPNLQILFDSEKYPSGNGLWKEDIDGDGKYEIVLPITTFEEFHVSHSHSKYGTAIMAYDENQKKYVLANNRYTEYLLKDIIKDLNSIKHKIELENLNMAANKCENNCEDKTGDKGANYFHAKESYFSEILGVTINYLYANKEEEAWKFFDQEYNLDDKAQIKKEMKALLKKDRIYQEINMLNKYKR